MRVFSLRREGFTGQRFILRADKEAQREDIR